MALLEEKESMEREDVEGRRKKEEAKRLLEAGMRRKVVEIGERLQELKERRRRKSVRNLGKCWTG